MFKRLRHWFGRGGSISVAAVKGNIVASRRGRRSRGRVKAFTAAVEPLESRDLPTVLYYGGPLMQRVQVQGLYYGSDWSTNPAVHDQGVRLEGFLGNVVNSSYMDMLTRAGYAVGRGGMTTGRIDPATIDKRYYLTDGKIQSVIQQDIFRGLEQPNANRLYVVFVEPGVAVKMGGDDSIRTFLGYHSSFVGYDSRGVWTNIYYAVIPYHGGINAQDRRLGVFDSMTETTSHEIAEAVTDPIPGRGWYDRTLNGEIGDLTRGVVRLNGYAVQNVVDRNDRPISPAGATPITSGSGVSGTGFDGVGRNAAAPRPVAGTSVHAVGGGASWIRSSFVIDAIAGATAVAEPVRPRSPARSAAFARL